MLGLNHAHSPIPIEEPCSISYNARRLGDVADGGRIDLNYHMMSKDAEDFLLPHQPPFR